jgi:glucose/arabinose dehydrogenase
MKIYRVFGLLLAVFLLGSCSSNQGQPPAPTSIPLENPQPGVIELNNPVNSPQYPLSLPQGFGVSVYATGLADPRMLAFGPDGQLYISEPSQGQIVRIIDSNHDGISDRTELAADDLLEPSGIAFYQDGSLYVAETTRIVRLSDPDGDGFFQEREIIAAGIAAGGNTNRSIIFSPDWNQLYLAIGSSCNVCMEEDPRRAGVMRFKADGSDPIIFTTGLHYVIGMAFRPDRDILWVANTEREGLTDDLPPETVYAIYIEANAGWPYCHAGRIVDPEYGKKDSCNDDLLTPTAELESQSAPYGMTFYTGDQFPPEYQSDLFIALHGTGNGEFAKGYKIVRIPLGSGEDTHQVMDFATGWVSPDGTPWGAPTDLIQGPDGSLFLSDDLQGAVYRIFYVGLEAE